MYDVDGFTMCKGYTGDGGLCLYMILCYNVTDTHVYMLLYMRVGALYRHYFSEVAWKIRIMSFNYREMI